MDENSKNEIDQELINTPVIKENENDHSFHFLIKTDLLERIMCIVMMLLSFIYTIMLTGSSEQVTDTYLLIFIIGFLGYTEVMYFKRKRTFESFLFLGLTVLLSVAYFFNITNVWEKEILIFFIHLFAVYYMLVRSDRLSEGKTSHLFMWDGLTGFFIMPFKNFPLLIRTIISSIRGTNEERKEKKNTARVWIIIGASFIGLILVIIAVSNLMKADQSYAKLLNNVLNVFKFKIDGDLVFRLFLTVLISFYLYGLFGGCYRETKEQVMHRGDNIKWFISKCNRVPNVIWFIFIGIVTIFYVVFFGLQGTYLWGAFSGTLPKGFIYSQYAREGFFNMCMVMGINLTLDWLLSRTSEKNHKSILIGRMVLGVESLLFSVVALLKLVMYINVYGFTPLRIESMWLIVVMILGCVLTMISAITKKKTARIWFITSAILLVGITFLYPNGMNF